MTRDYKRNGTTALFGALKEPLINEPLDIFRKATVDQRFLNTMTGEVIGCNMQAPQASGAHLLPKRGRRRLRKAAPAAFQPLVDLRAAINRFIKEHNATEATPLI